MMYTGQEYEKDERWQAVDRYAVEQLDRNNTYNQALQEAKELGEQENLPNIEVSVMQGKFLAVQAQLINAKNILEVGTLGGYSAIWLASTGANITTIEVDPRHKQVAEKAIAKAGLAEQVQVLLGAGIDVLPKLRAEVEAGQRARYDMVFIDADKENNLNYFTEAVKMTRSRACIVVDNVVRRGRLADAQAATTDSRVRGAREVVEAVASHELVLQSTLMQTVGEKNYDGFLMVVTK